LSPALTRRGLVQGGAAVLGASVAGISAPACAAADPDAGLFAALARYDEAHAAWITTDAPHDEAMSRAAAARPPRPKVLDACWQDTLAGLEPSGREKRPDGTWNGYFVQGDVDRLRATDPVILPAWTDDGEPLPGVPYPEGEARRQEVIGAHDAWQVECAAINDAVGLTDAIRANDAACAVLNEAEDEVERLPARTTAGLAAKARWVASAFEDGGSIDTLERFVQQMAAFGEVAS
jgi:hypothetical protein